MDGYSEDTDKLKKYHPNIRSRTEKNKSSISLKFILHY